MQLRVKGFNPRTIEDGRGLTLSTIDGGRGLTLIQLRVGEV